MREGAVALAFAPHGAVHAHARPWAEPLDRREWLVRRVPHAVAREFVGEHHYSGGCANTSVAAVGLFHRSGSELMGVAVWMPPTVAAARSVAGSAHGTVLALSRLACRPDAPKFSAGFLIANGIRLLPERWSALLTYADEMRNHVGIVYQATNWRYLGLTNSGHPTWAMPDGRLVSRKVAGRMRTVAELREMGARRLGVFGKHKYVLDRFGRPERETLPYPRKESPDA